jgi:ABC-type Fe3+/spermidine/putrescine transport system ATPase subunit
VPHLELAHLSKDFGTIHAVQDLNLRVERGCILSIVGPSGCGKTTTLRMIAGLEVPTSGSIRANDRDLTRVPARQRNIGMVFQNYALFPHLDVFENIAFGLRTRQLPKPEVEARVAKTLKNVRLEGTSSAAASNNVSRWRGPSPSSPRCFCWTSRSVISIHRCVKICGTRFGK